MTNYLKEHSFPLRSVTDGEDFSDLQPLKEILKGVRIVGLGESTHGTREYFQLKHRLTRFLVEEMGFRVFTIEAGVIPCMNINDYITMGKGDRAKALASQGYWTWDTEEVTEMIEWMRQHNLHCPKGEEVSFMGYDVKPIADACEHLRRILPKMSKALADRYLPEIDRIEALAFPYRGEKLDNDAMTMLMGALALDEITYSAATSRGEYDLAVASARKMWQYMEAMVLGGSGVAARDYYMADNIIRIFNNLPSDAKIVVWAHNFHIANIPGCPNMGARLKDFYGDLYFPFALMSDKGAFQSRPIETWEGSWAPGDLQEIVQDHAVPGTIEHKLQDLREGMYYFDLRTALRTDKETRDVLAEPMRTFESGGAHRIYTTDEENLKACAEYDYSEAFDGIFFVRDTTRARPTPSGMRKKGQGAK